MRFPLKRNLAEGNAQPGRRTVARRPPLQPRTEGPSPLHGQPALDPRLAPPRNALSFSSYVMLKGWGLAPPRSTVRPGREAPTAAAAADADAAEAAAGRR